MLTRRGLFAALVGVSTGAIGARAASPHESPWTPPKGSRLITYRADQIIAFYNGEAFILKNRHGETTRKRMPGNPQRVIAVMSYPTRQVLELI